MSNAKFNPADFLGGSPATEPTPPPQPTGYVNATSVAPYTTPQGGYLDPRTFTTPGHVAPVYTPPPPPGPVGNIQYSPNYNNTPQYENSEFAQDQPTKNPAHGKVYNTYNPKTRRSGQTVTLTAEGVQYLLQNINAVVQNPSTKIKFKIAEYPEHVKQSVAQRGGHAVGAVYIKFDDGQRQSKYGEWY